MDGGLYFVLQGTLWGRNQSLMAQDNSGLAILKKYHDDIAFISVALLSRDLPDLQRIELNSGCLQFLALVS